MCEGRFPDVGGGKRTFYACVRQAFWQRESRHSTDLKSGNSPYGGEAALKPLSTRLYGAAIQTFMTTES